MTDDVSQMLAQPVVNMAVTRPWGGGRGARPGPRASRGRGAVTRRGHPFVLRLHRVDAPAAPRRSYMSADRCEVPEIAWLSSSESIQEEVSTSS